jgi:hypothetical protein
VAEPKPETTAAMIEILNHLVQNPAARDTPEGIRSWWVGPSHSAVTVKQGLDDLAESRWLLVHRSSVGVETFGLNPEALDEIRAFLANGHPKVAG